MLGGRYAFPVMARYLVLQGGRLQDARDATGFVLVCA